LFCTGDDVQHQCSSELYYIGDFTFNGRDYKIFPEKAEKAFGDERNWTSNQNSFVQERLAGMPIIQVFNRQEEFKKFDDINITLKSALLRTVFIFSLFFPVVELFLLFLSGLSFFTEDILRSVREL
jgi:ABC-type multidrug transport system fused ATPase/permease subunit